jgi:hypothetical protein
MRASFSIGELQSEELSAFTLDAAHAALLGTTWARLATCAQRPEVASR